MEMKNNFTKAAKELLGTLAEAKPAAASAPDGTGAAAAPKAAVPKAAGAPQTQTQTQRPTSRPAVSAQHTVIAVGDAWKGDLCCCGCVDLYGEMEGNITGSGNVSLSGRLKGDAAGHDVDVCGGRIVGNIMGSGSVRVDGDAVVTGNIRAKELTVNGKVKGDLDVEGTLIMGETAVALGRITVGRISVADGAALRGEVTIRCGEFEKHFPENGRDKI